MIQRRRKRGENEDERERMRKRERERRREKTREREMGCKKSQKKSMRFLQLNLLLIISASSTLQRLLDPEYVAYHTMAWKEWLRQNTARKS